MIAALKALPTHPKIYIITPPPLYPPYPYEMNVTVINQEFGVLLPAIAAQTGITGTIDVFNALGGANLTMPGIT